ncbi:MAG: GTP 3',8-cyclase MoaA [Candidatus Sumerlaeaceae bacterium]|nr:GTP 3',8-cyclase MoaA [Candidatus Sumerlaeaceae bacterium]
MSISPAIPTASAATGTEASAPGRLVDPFGRAITYVRISVTDRCNLRCQYCMPHEGPDWLERETIMSFEEIARFVRVAAAEGVSKVRLTGGEPLVRKDLPKLVDMISSVPGIRDLAMTTNGTLLRKFARDLKSAGLTRLNISLDTLHADRFKEIAKFDMFDDVWGGIMAALDAGFAPLKINMVVIRGFNEDEVVDFALLTRKYPFIIRYIEYMPIGGDQAHWERGKVFPCADIRRRIEEREELEPVETDAKTSGPERVLRLKDSLGRIGFITPVSDEFCAGCNRVRLTSDGMLRGCLMRDGEVDFRGAFRNGATDEEIRELLYHAIARKPEKHLINSPDFVHSSFYTMNRLGG